MPDINSNLNYNRPRDLAIGRKLKAAGKHQPTVQSTLDVSMPAHAARATALAVAELYPSDIPARKQTTLDATMPAHAARAAELAAHPRAEKRRIHFVIPDLGTDEESESDSDTTDLFRSRSTKRRKTNEERQREIDAEARHNAQCEANRRAKDERLRRDNAALDAAVANPATFRQPVRLSINFNFRSGAEIAEQDAESGWYPDSDSDSDSDGYTVVVEEATPGQTTFEIRDPITGRLKLKGNRKRAFAFQRGNGGFLFQKEVAYEKGGKTHNSYKAVHVDNFEVFVAIARRGGHVYSLIGQHTSVVYIDIDAKKCEMEAANTDHDGVLTRSMRGLRTFFHEWYGLDVKSTDFYCAHACAEEKASWHLHLHMTFTAEERQIFRDNLLQAKKSDPNLEFVDASPYTKTCSLRCIGSSKVGHEDRVLVACAKWGDVEFAYKPRNTRVEDGITFTDPLDIGLYLPNNPHIIAMAPILTATKRAVIKRTRTVLRRSAPRVKVDMVEGVRTRIIAAVRAYGDNHSAIAEWNGRTAIIRSTNRVCYHCDGDKHRVHKSNGACIRLETDGRLRYRCFSSKCPNTYVTIDTGSSEDYFEPQTLMGADGVARFFAVEADEIYDSEKDKVFREDTGAPCTRVLDLVKHPIIMLREGLGMGKTKQTVDAIHTPIVTRFREITRPSIAWGHHRISLGKDVLCSYGLRAEPVDLSEEHTAAVIIQRAWRRYKQPPEPAEGEWTVSEPTESHPILNSWDHYQDSDIFAGPVHRIMCQIDSFYRFQPRSADDSYTPHVLVLDELHDLLRQLVGSRARVDSWKQLLRMARGAHRIVCMDGLGDELAHKFFQAVGREVHWRENTYKPHRGVEHRFVHWMDGHAHIITSLEAGKKLFIPCASKSHLISLEADIAKEGFTCVSLHADTPQDLRKRLFADLSGETRECDVFLMSPTITSGCSIDHARFDETVFVLSTGSVVADAVWQMVWRVRHLNSQKVTYMCDNTVGNGVYYSESRTANRLRNPTRLKELVIQRSRETDTATRHVSSRELRELNAMAFESDALRSKDSLWPIILHVANEQDNRRFEMLPRLYDIIENSGGILHRLPKVAKEDRDKVRTNRVDKSALWEALSTAADVDEELYKTIRRLRNRGEATQRQQHEIQRYELRVAFGKAMPDEPSAKWFATYHNRADQFRRLSMLGCHTDTVQQAHASRIRIARSAERGSRESHASCNMTDGDQLVVATELLRAGGFTGPLDKSKRTKADLVSRLPAMHAVITGWNSARRGTLIKTKPTLSVMINSARGILGQSLGVSIANVGTRKTPIYAVAGFHEWPVPKFKSGRAKKVSFKPPLWNVIGGMVTTR